MFCPRYLSLQLFGEVEDIKLKQELNSIVSPLYISPIGLTSPLPHPLPVWHHRTAGDDSSGCDFHLKSLDLRSEERMKDILEGYPREKVGIKIMFIFKRPSFLYLDGWFMRTLPKEVMKVQALEDLCTLSGDFLFVCGSQT